MITLEMVRKGLEENLITLTDEEYGTACRIGSGWFYFGGTETDNVSPEEYLAFLEECGGDIAEEIFEQLENMRYESGYEDEYTGYEWYLKNNLYKAGERKLHVIVCGASDDDPHKRCAYVKTFLPGENINIFKPEEEAFACLDYSLANRFSTKMQEAAAEGKEFWKAEAVVNTGGSEGVYIDCRLLLYPEGVIDVGTYKTLDDGMDAYIKMGMIAGAFTKAAEEYLYVNSL